jgi:hypothetical protein
MEHDALGTGRSSSDSDMVRVAAKGADVPLDPIKSHSLVLESVVNAATLEDLSAGQKSIRPNSIVQGDNNNVIVACNDKS